MISNKIMLEDWQIDAFVGTNIKYYKKKWKEHSGIIYGGWNWVAFFFGIEWAIYRKMYGMAILGTLITSVIGFVLMMLLNIGLNGKFYGDILKIIFAIWGNGIYRKKLMTLLKKTKSMTKTEQECVLSQKGGTNILGLCAFVVFEVLTLIVMISRF